MIINKIKLKGFRNIDTSIFELKDLIALISTNNYGKSNVLEGIRFGINFIKYNDLGKDYMMKWTRGIPLNRKQELENYKIEFEMETNIDKKEYIIQYGYEFKWFRNDGTGQKIVGEYLKFKEKEDKRFSIYIDRNENEAFFTFYIPVTGCIELERRREDAACGLCESPDGNAVQVQLVDG